jgi:hypothetical protein
MENYTDIEVSAVLKVLAYYDVFDYPLTFDEIFKFSQGLSQDQVSTELKRLTEDSVVYKMAKFYSLKNDNELAINREQGNKRIQVFTRKAIRRAKLISKFPYVRAVFISGSFSKGYMPLDGDIDYFVITKHNRMWLARTLLILYKKVFLFNSRKFFCVNYFLGEKDLKIDQNNVFTATEIFTLKPIINKELYKVLIEENKWVGEYYDFNKIKTHDVIEYKSTVIQSILEIVFNNKVGEKLDLYCMKLTLKRWQRKFPNLPKVDFKIAFKSTRNVSKHHPSNFQKKVLDSYNKTINNLKNV